MASFVFGTGLALVLVGGVFVGPIGLLLSAAGLVVAVVTGIRTRGRAAGRGLLVGITEAAVAIGLIASWSGAPRSVTGGVDTHLDVHVAAALSHLGVDPSDVGQAAARRLAGGL